MELEMLCRFLFGAMNSVSQYCTLFFVLLPHWRCYVVVLFFLSLLWEVKRSINIPFLYFQKMGLQSDWEKWGANLKHTHTQKKIEYNDTKIHPSLFVTKFFQCEVWMPRGINTFDILFICMCVRTYIRMHDGPCIWDVINVDTRLEDLRQITAIIINILTLQHKRQSFDS